jgi:hypothetical protein
VRGIGCRVSDGRARRTREVTRHTPSRTSRAWTALVVEREPAAISRTRTSATTKSMHAQNGGHQRRCRLCRTEYESPQEGRSKRWSLVGGLDVSHPTCGESTLRWRAASDGRLSPRRDARDLARTSARNRRSRNARCAHPMEVGQVRRRRRRTFGRWGRVLVTWRHSYGRRPSRRRRFPGRS